MNWIHWGSLYFLILTALICAALTPLARKLAFRWDLLDRPGPRKAQREPVPYLGGLAVFVAFFVVFVVHLSVIWSDAAQTLAECVGAGELLASHLPLVRERLAPVLMLLAGCTLSAGIGLVDDKLGARFPAWAKLGLQVLAALIAVAAGARTDVLVFPWLNVLASVVWIVAITNAVNFCDNMDGLASGLVLISAAILWAVAAIQLQFFIALSLAVVAGAVIGFFPYNFNPASIYLGDAGSLFLGYTIGVLTMLESYVTPETVAVVPIALPIIVLTVPVVDLLSVVVIRLREGRPIYVGDRSHLSHRLVDMGFSVKGAVSLLYLIALAFGLHALTLLEVSPRGAIFTLGAWVLGLVLISILLVMGRRAARS